MLIKRVNSNIFGQDDAILFFFFSKMENKMGHQLKTCPITQLIHIALQW